MCSAGTSMDAAQMLRTLHFEVCQYETKIHSGFQALFIKPREKLSLVFRHDCLSYDRQGRVSSECKALEVSGTPAHLKHQI